MDYLGPRNKTKQTQMRLGKCDSQVLLLVLHMYSQTTLYGHLLNTDRGKKTLFSLQPAGHGYPVNMGTFYGSLCVRFNGF